MVLQAVHPWTLGGLIGAFLELALAYFLLCLSASAFFASKFLSCFGRHLPCPCRGVFGYKNTNLCLHRLLVDLPAGIIYYVQKSVMSKFPFDLIWFKDRVCYSDKKSVRDGNGENGVLGLENETSCNLLPSVRLRNSVQPESGFGSRGKKVINLKQRSGIRRRRRATLDNGKFSSVLLDDDSRSVADGNSAFDGRDRGNTSENLGPASGREDDFLGEITEPSGIDWDERSQNSFELSRSIYEDHGALSSVETSIVNAKLGFVENESSAIRRLELALEEEKAARAALYLELEKERAAAATAADEAIAMISRLQHDKASVEMEARQYQRMIEEKFAYDEEEMDILKEILVRREKENHFLEKELEEYKQMDFLELEPADDLNDKVKTWGEKPSSSQDVEDEEQFRLIENNMSIGNKVTNFANPSSVYVSSIVEKQRQTHGYGSHKKNVLLAAKEKEKRDKGVVCQRMTTEPAQICHCIETKFSCDGEQLKKDGEDKDQASSHHPDPLHDTEPAVYDVHVIDDSDKIWKNRTGKESRSSISNAIDESGDCAITMGMLEVSSRDTLSDHPIISKEEATPNIQEGSLDRTVGLLELSRSLTKSLLSELGEESPSVVNNEKLKIDFEIEQLRERLHMVQEEKENLTLHTENGDKEKDPLNILEEISDQLQEIQRLRDAMQQVSLTPSSSEVVLKKRPPESGSYETHEST